VTEYLTRGTPDFTAPDTVAAFDELPLWCAMAGLFLLEHLPLPRGAAALDVGCGTGFPLLELAQRLGPPAVVHGLDPWGAALARARFKAGVIGVANVTLTRGDGTAMPTRLHASIWSSRISASTTSPTPTPSSPNADAS
jgi:SAM-dependent methyltransferase